MVILIIIIVIVIKNFNDNNNNCNSKTLKHNFLNIFTSFAIQKKKKKKKKKIKKKKSFKIKQIDIIVTFQNPNLTKEVYMKPLKGTMNLGLKILRKESRVAFVEEDYARGVETRRLTIRFITCMGETSTSWFSKLQTLRNL